MARSCSPCSASWSAYRRRATLARVSRVATMATPATASTIAVGSSPRSWISAYPVASAEATSGSASSGYPDEPVASRRAGPGRSPAQVVPYQIIAPAAVTASGATASISGVPR